MAGEIKAKKIGADVLMVAEPSYYLSLKKDNLLLDYVSPNLRTLLPIRTKKAHGLPFVSAT